MKIPKEVKVGVVAIMAVAMFVIGYNYLRGQDIFTSTNEYYGVYEKIDGLIPSNPVLLNGFKVGSVTDIQMDDKTRELTVEITVPSNINIPANTIMKLVNTDVIGAKGIELIWGDSSVIAADGAFLPSQKDPGIAQAAGEIFGSLTQSLDKVLGEINSAVSEADMGQTLRDASSALKSFKETADKLNSLLEGKNEQVTLILNNVESTTAGLKDLAPRIDSISAQLEKTTRSISSAEIDELVSEANRLIAEMNTLSQKINSTDGTLGKLVNEDDLYVQLDSTLKKLEVLLIDIEKYPSRYTGITGGQRRRAEKAKAKAETEQ